MMLSDIFLTRFLTDVVHLNHPETSQRRFAPTPDHFTGISGPLHWNTHSCNTFCTCALRPSKPRRRSVTPAAIQILVSTGSWITGADSPGSNATEPDQRRSP